MVQNLRAYFIPHFITIKCKKRMQEKIEFFWMLQIPTLISIKILGDLSLTTKIKQHQQLQEILRGGKKMAPCCPEVAFATPCHPMATGLLRLLITLLLRDEGKF